MPEVRVFSNGWNSMLPANSRFDLRDVATELLCRLEGVPYLDSAKSRPLILIGHGVGGLIIKQVSELSGLLSPFIRAVTASLFSPLPPLHKTADYPFPGLRPSQRQPPLPSHLPLHHRPNLPRHPSPRPQPPPLQRRPPCSPHPTQPPPPLPAVPRAQQPHHGRSLHPLPPLPPARQIAQLLRTGGPEGGDDELVVPRVDALLEISDEGQVPVQADHFGICRFDSVKDSRGEVIWGKIEGLVQGSMR